ncbi:MAG: phosphatidate cytidylyltransferase [Candidatus Petromonas sp.]|jgi:phosphatidate cytidylyltransferase|nr:phosphatidate cytidylyltransferase [Candidatus Petromonas sp.]
MVKRIVSGIIGIPLLIYIVSKGGFLFTISLLVIVLLALREFYNAFDNLHISPLKYVGYLFTIIMYLAFSYKKLNITLLIFFMITLTVLLIFLFNKKTSFMDLAITLVGFLYVSYFLFHILLISSFLDTYIIWFVFIIAWATDTFAYFSGYFFGRRKLFPEVSPKKTVEGSIGGMIGSILICIIFSYLLKPDFIIHSIFLGFIGSILSQIGDLIASKIKRHVGIKDYGNLIPGHGGILDRFDSILLTSPFVYYYVTLFIN